MYKLEKTYSFSSAHHLEDTPSLITKKCLGVHGHRWVVKVSIEAFTLVDDMVIDFGAIKEIITLLDHKDLNEVFKFNPTAENISQFLWRSISALFSRDIELRVTVEESPGAKVTYWE